MHSTVICLIWLIGSYAFIVAITLYLLCDGTSPVYASVLYLCVAPFTFYVSEPPVPVID
jgi:hypothetical protein